MSAEAAGVPEWHPTACVLCACNRGVEVQAADGNITRVKGDKAHPGSKGYACEKAQRLSYYQGGPRITAPLRRRPDGGYEEVDWETAIEEVAAGLVRSVASRQTSSRAAIGATGWPAPHGTRTSRLGWRR